MRRRDTILRMSSAPDSITLTCDSDAPRRAYTRRERFVRGLSSGLPILLGYLPVGMAFGILARRLGFTTWEAIVCSATALAGAGQFIALSLLSAGAGVVATVLATAVVNLRYVLFGTTLSPHLRGVDPRTQAWLAFTLTDETFAVNIAEAREGTASPASMAGVGLIAWVGWVSGTIIGALGAAWVGDPSTWGVDFAMPAMFSALFVALAPDRKHALVGLFAACIVITLALLGAAGLSVPTNWFVIIASMAAASVASVVTRAR